jgi:Arc/MetJ-type ribon-helix-helix transcriptional regulator
MKDKKKEKTKTPMRNITINIPDIYDKNIQWLISKKLTASRSEAIRTALREYLHSEYGNNLELLGYAPTEKEDQK